MPEANAPVGCVFPIPSSIQPDEPESVEILLKVPPLSWKDSNHKKLVGVVQKATGMNYADAFRVLRDTEPGSYLSLAKTTEFFGYGSPLPFTSMREELEALGFECEVKLEIPPAACVGSVSLENPLVLRYDAPQPLTNLKYLTESDSPHGIPPQRIFSLLGIGADGLAISREGSVYAGRSPSRLFHVEGLRVPAKLMEHVWEIPDLRVYFTAPISTLLDFLQDPFQGRHREDLLRELGIVLHEHLGSTEYLVQDRWVQTTVHSF